MKALKFLSLAMLMAVCLFAGNVTNAATLRPEVSINVAAKHPRHHYRHHRKPPPPPRRHHR